MVSGRCGPAALVLAAAALAGCGTSADAGPGEGADADQATGVGRVSAGSTAQFANCKAWRRGTVEQRYATIRAIRGQPESALSDEDAYRIFEKTCAASFSDTLRLYKLYARAEAFAPLTGEGG